MGGSLERQLILRPPGPGDAALFAELNGLPSVQRFIGRLVPSSRDMDVRVIESQEGLSVGVVSMGRSDFSQGEYFELVCAVIPSQQGKGFACGACRDMLRFARLDGGPLVVGCVDRSNSAGQRLLARLGAKYLRRRGAPHDEQDVYVLD